MHHYAIDSEERRVVPFFLAVLGILAALGLTTLLALSSISVPWWLDAPATMGFYSIFYTAFDRWAWKLPILRILGLKTPILEGRWTGEVVSSYDERAKSTRMEVDIVQTWTKIKVSLETPNSRSHSLIAGVVTEAQGGSLVTYEYLNEPRASAPPTMQIHRGIAKLRLIENDTVFEGEYFSGRGRQNYGSFRLTKQTTQA
jgi:hypothetical protein